MNTSIFNKRRAGLLVPAYSLRHAHDFGIGDTLAVKDALDFSADAGFEVLQLLPIHETHGDHSPYSPISSRALSPALLALTPDQVPGLTDEMLTHTASEAWLAELRKGNVSQEAVHPLKIQILMSAYHEFILQPLEDSLRQEFIKFKTDQQDWISSYTLFRVLIREYEGNTNWADWRPEHRSAESAEAWLVRQPAREIFERLRDTFAFIQWVAWRQWKSVKEHATKRGVRLLGEISFGLSNFSSDVWANPALFDPEWFLGSRPMAHFDTSKDSERWGQNWGFFAFRWENHRSTGFKWLRGRAIWVREFFHGARLDHLRGYFRAYMFPWAGGARHVEFANLTESEAMLQTGGRLPRFVPGDDNDPLGRQMNELQGKELISQLIDAAGDMDLVGEIMGDLPEYMSRSLEELQIASLVFPQLQKDATRSIHAAATFRKLSLVAYANHDNAPLAMLLMSMREKAMADPEGSSASDLRALLEFAGQPTEPWPETLNDHLLEGLQNALFQTPCQLAVLMCSDMLGIPLRFNLPGSYGRGTWSDRLEMTFQEFLAHPIFGQRIRNVTELVQSSGRGAES